MAYSIQIWQGSGSFYAGDTPYGFYDNDSDFQEDIEKAADWAGRRLGHYIQDVEIIDKHFFAAYEEAVNEYGYYLNTYAARDNILLLLGLPSEDLDLTQKYIPSNSSGMFQIANEYSTQAGIGGTLTHYTGSITLQQNQSVYDLKSTSHLRLETGSFSNNKKFTIRKIFHEIPPAVTRYFDPYVSSGLTSDGMLNEFGWGKMSPGVSFVVMPISWDVLRMQAIEFNDHIRKSAYTFKLTNDRLTIFPRPTETGLKLWFTYTLDAADTINTINDSNSVDSVSDMSTVPYFNITYCKLNDIARNWIRNYFLTICKETLGRIRGKYSSLPIPDNEITLNYTELLSEAQAEKEALRLELKEYLDSFSRQKQLEKKTAEAQNLQDYLKYVPMKIYTGIFLTLIISIFC